MKNLLLLFLLTYFSPVFAADFPTAIPGLGNDQWESHPDAGVAVAFLLKNDKLTVYIKNISSVQKFFTLTGRDGWDMKIFYIDTHNVQQALHPIDPMDDIVSLNYRTGFSPNQIFSYVIALKGNDFYFLTSHPTQATFTIYDEGVNQGHEVTTASRQLYLTQ